jgi:MFS family permease
LTDSQQDTNSTINSVFAFFFINGLLFGTWASRIPATRDQFDLTSTRLGMLLFCVAIGAVLAMIVTGRILDRFGQLRLSRMFAWAMALAFVLIPLSPNVMSLAVVLTFMGFSGGGLDVSMNALASDLEKVVKRSLMSRFHGVWSVGTTLGTISGLLTIGLGLGTLTHFVLISGASLGIMLFLDRGTWGHTPDDAGAKPTPFRLPRGALALVCLFAFVTFLGEGIVIDWGMILLVDLFFAPEPLAAAGLIVFTSTMMMVRLFADPFIDKIGPYKSARTAAIIASIGAILVASAPAIWVVFLGYFTLGLGLSVMAPLAFSQAGKIPGVSTGQAMSSVAVLGYGSLLFGPPIVGFVADVVSLRAAFVGLALLSMVLIATARVFRTEAKGN